MKRQYASFLTFVLVLASCNFPSPEAATETPPTFPPIPVTPEAVTETPPSPEVDDFSPILYKQDEGSAAFLLLGGVGENEWSTPELTVARITGVFSYDAYEMTDDRYSISGGVEGEPICSAYFVAPETAVAGSGLVGVLQGWQVTQRNVEELASDGGFYRQVVADWLTAEGVPAPQIDSMQVLRVDIEGDGVDEVFISAHHFVDESGHMTEAGDYSVVLMRKVAGDDVLTLAVTGKIHTSAQPELTFPFTYSLANFIDLNQDGILEAVIGLKRWEGFGAAVFRIDGQETVQVLHEVCAL
jgi:hypothetical protein